MPGLAAKERALNRDSEKKLLSLWNSYLEEKVNCPIEFLIASNELS